MFFIRLWSERKHRFKRYYYTEKNAGRTQITVLVKYAFSINEFEKAVEEKFPEIDLVQVGNYTSDMGVREYASRIANDDLTDIVMTWPVNVGEEYWEDRLLELSGMSFTSNYNISTLNNIARDGKLYYLPGPSQVRGIIYNKTLFKENGWKVPDNYEEFISLCQSIEASGIRSLQLGFGNPEVLDTAFTGYSYGNCLSTPQDTQWFTEFNNGKGSFGDQFGSAIETFQDMIDAGIWKKEDLNVYYQDRERMLFTRQCAMVKDSVLLARMGYDLTGSTDEFALMPFFNPGADNDWARLYMVCYIGLNKHLAEPVNRDKYDLVLKLMDYISTQEGQKTLSSDTGAMFSSVIGTDPPDIPEIMELLPALEHGRFAIFPQLTNAQSALREGLAGMIRGTLSGTDVVKMVDEQNQNPPAEEQAEVIGSADKNFTMIETGSYITDAMQRYSGSDAALFMDNGKDGKYNGKGICSKIYAGDITTEDMKRLMPDLKHGETGTLWTVTMTGENLINTLEYAIPVDNNITGWFYYFSGLKVIFDPCAEPGSRVKEIHMADGSAVEPQKTYTIAVMDETVPEEYLISCVQSGVTIESIVTEAIRRDGVTSPASDDRFIIADN